MPEYDQHHVVPRSRDRRSKKTVRIPKSFHAAWNIVFENLYGKETEQFLMMVNRAMETYSIITPKDLETWRRVSMGIGNIPDFKPGWGNGGRRGQGEEST